MADSSVVLWVAMKAVQWADQMGNSSDKKKAAKKAVQLAGKMVVPMAVQWAELSAFQMAAC